MKTPKEWAEEFLKTKEWWPIKGTFEWIAAIQADARVGMVPEGELAEVKQRWRQEATEHRALAAMVEAELAKAWEAGRDAGARLAESVDLTTYSRGTGQPNTGVFIAECIRALQPPGGKAK